jgi:heme oxygenase
MEYLEKLRAQVRDGLTSVGWMSDVLARKPDPKIYARYLTNVWHYAQHSGTVIGLAGTRCVLSHPPLAQYLMHHALEELGHDQWALDDLKALGISEAEIRKTRPVPACAAMVGFEYYIAGYGNPVGLFGWLYVLEAMGDDLGHAVADGFKEGLALPEGVKFLAGHGEADVEHTRDIIEHIETHIKGADLEEVHHVANVIADIYPRMFQEIAEGR